MRNFRRSFHRSLPREPLVWDRSVKAITQDTAVSASVASVDIFDPSVIQGSRDERITIRRIMVNIAAVFSFSAGTIAAGDGFQWAMGIYARRYTETVRDPLMTAQADQQTDWMQLYGSASVFSGAGAGFVLPNFELNRLNAPGLIEVKTNRKLDNDMLVTLAFKVNGTAFNSGHTSTVTMGAKVLVSTLWQRTMRRK